MNTPAFFNAFQNYMVRVLEAGHQGSSLLSFWSSVTTQAIDGVLDQSSSGQRAVQDQKTEELLYRVLPVLNACMRSGNGAEAVTACYMIIIVLVTKTSFEDKILDTLMEAAIISQDNETTDACLVCLAVLAEERSQVQLLPAVLKRLLRIQNLSQTFVALSKRCRIDRLTLGAALGALENIEGSEESEQIFRELIESNLLDEPQLSVALSALVQVLRRSERTSPEHSHLIDYASKLSDLPAVSRLLQAVAQKTSTDLEYLGLTLGSSLENAPAPVEDEDEEMLDADDDQTNSAPLVLPPEIREMSFLAATFSETFQATRAAFNQAVASNRTAQFLAAENLQQPKAFQTPLYFSFLARVWCSQDPIMTRIAALRSATALIKSNDRPTNLQNLIPYLLYVLADPSATLRRSAIACIAAVSAKANASPKAAADAAWGSSDLYGKNASKMTSLSGEEATGLLSVLVPMLEECAMDANFAITTLRGALDGTQTMASKHVLKAALRSHIISFLGGHSAVTPLISVRTRLLPLFSFVGKSSATVRSNIILPAIRAWCSLPYTEARKSCDNEQIATLDAERAHVAALVSREAESVNLLKDVLSGKCSKDRPELLDASFDWLVSSWSSIRSDARLELSLNLLDLSLQDSHSDFDGQCRKRSSETLRAVKLDSVSLISLLESVPSSVQMPEGPPTKKRRRTSRNELARTEHQSPDDVARLLRRLTLVLELIEGSNPGEHPTLFRTLFTVLGELQQLKQQSGSDLVYLQSLVLSSLTPIVNRIKAEKDTTEYQAAVRADLLIDCIRHSASPQVQNAALLLIATLASWVPELILHNLMPIFTFIGSTLLRQHDDYSAHVVDQVRAQSNEMYKC